MRCCGQCALPSCSQHFRCSPWPRTESNRPSSASRWNEHHSVGGRVPFLRCSERRRYDVNTSPLAATGLQFGASCSRSPSWLAFASSRSGPTSDLGDSRGFLRSPSEILLVCTASGENEEKLVHRCRASPVNFQCALRSVWRCRFARLRQNQRKVCETRRGPVPLTRRT